MDDQYFSLELHSSNRLTRIFQLIFGIICAIVAVIWVVINLNTIKMTFALWVTLLFLLGFAYFQIVSGLGMADKFIEFSRGSIRLKRNSLLPPVELKFSEIEKIEIFPVNVVFFLKKGKKLILRFGTTFTDNINPVKDAIGAFCKNNDLLVEFRNEGL